MQFTGRMPNEFVPGQQPLVSRFSDTTPSSDRTNTGGVSLAGLAGREQLDQTEAVRTYLAGLSIKDNENTRADQMSRER